jgi:hypothetical protein
MKGNAALPAAMVACTDAIACELPPGGQEIASRDGGIALSYRPDPAGLAVDRQFSLIVHVCSKARSMVWPSTRTCLTIATG